MSEDATSEGTITRIELTGLADLFDKFEFAFDPRSTAAKEAESEFDDKVKQLFEERVRPNHPEVGFAVFHCRLKSLCREYLRKNAP
jgi:hypothetical protein